VFYGLWCGLAARYWLPGVNNVVVGDNCAVTTKRTAFRTAIRGSLGPYADMAHGDIAADAALNIIFTMSGSCGDHPVLRDR